MLYRRYAQCPVCHTVWTSHSKPAIDDERCPECDCVMESTPPMHDWSNVMLSPGWHRLCRRVDHDVQHATDSWFIAMTFMCGQDENGERWGDALVRLPMQTLSLRDDALILLAYRFDTFLPRLSDDDLREAVRQYTANTYKILAEMTMRGIAQQPIQEKPKRKRKATV